MPGAEWRRRRLWKISRYSKIASAGSRRIRQCCRLSRSVCILPQNDAIVALP